MVENVLPTKNTGTEYTHELGSFYASGPVVVMSNVAQKKQGEGMIQASSVANKSVPVVSELQNKIQSLKGAGQPLSMEERGAFESRFFTSFSNVRVHSDSSSARIAHSINARAFTHGNDVVSGVGEYSLGSDSGRKTDFQMWRKLAKEYNKVASKALRFVKKAKQGNRVARKKLKEDFSVRKMGAMYRNRVGRWSEAE